TLPPPGGGVGVQDLRPEPARPRRPPRDGLLDMTMTTDNADRFRSLHRSGAPLVLPNAWDVASARLVEDAGAAAVATSSAGVAWSLGAPDGNKLARDQAVALVARIASAVEVPVTADIESGFAEDADGVAETIRQ